MKIIVHENVDLDAVLCLVLADASVGDTRFISSAARELPSGWEDARVLDHPLGEKGRLDADGTRHAAALAMPEARNVCPRLLAEADEQDSTGRVLAPRFSLAEILAGLRAWYGAQGFRAGPALDVAVWGAMEPVLRGLMLLHAKRAEAERVADSCRVEDVAGVRIAILPPGDHGPLVGIVLAERGIAGAIYQDGLMLGVTRYPGYDRPDLRLLAPGVPGWFVHSAGFLACWGSRKARPTTPPPTGTPQTQDDLLAVMRELLNERLHIADARRKARDARRPCEKAASNAYALYFRLADAEVMASEAVQVALVASIEALTERVAAMEKASAPPAPNPAQAQETPGNRETP